MTPRSGLLTLAAALLAGAVSAGPGAAADQPQPADLAVSADAWRTDFTVTDIPLSEIQPSVPRDAIPPIDDPVFESIAQAREWMDARAPVLTLEIADEARAYPLSIMLWHDIVND